MKLFTGLQVGLLVVVAACGKIPDASDGGADDDDQPDAKPQMGKASLVVTHDDGMPVGAATVVHAGPDGTLIETLQTGSDGKLEVNVTSGDMLHVGFLEGEGKRLYTVFGVEAGDVIPVNARPPQDPDLGQLTVIAQALPTGAVNAEIHAGCTDNNINPQQLTTTLFLRESCKDAGGKIAVVGAALDDKNKVVATTVRTGVSPPADGAAATIDLEPWTAAGAASVSLTISNVPEGVVGVGGELTAFRGKQRYQRFETSSGGAAVTLQAFVAPGYADTLQYNARTVFAGDTDGNDGVVFVLGKSAYSSGEATLTANLGNTLPRIHGAAYEAQAHRFSWQVSAADQAQTDRLAHADVVAIQFSWSDQPGGSSQNLWSIIGPGSTSSPLEVDLHDLEGLAPPGTGGVLPVTVMALDLDSIDDYTDLKTRLGTNFFSALDSGGAFAGVASFSGEGPR
jgi:hypothetical protein